MGDVLSCREVAILLGVSPSTVRSNAHEWGGFRIGKLWKFPRHRIEALLPPGTLAPQWPVAPESPSTTAKHAAPTAFDGATNTASREKTAGTPPKTRRRTRQTKSDGAFARDFPEYLHLAQ